MRFKYLKVFVICFAFLLTCCFVNVDADSLQNIIDNSSDGKVVLDQDYTEEVSIATGKSITLDLNGNTITGVIDVYGTLVVKDSKTGGTIVGNNNSGTGAIYAKGGNITLESGTIINNKGYGIGAFNSGKVTINGGTISSLYAGLAGNNVNGDMYFIVNDGVITAKEGPAVYMPGQVSLDINGGTLNGGISLRMGIVTITGGIINAATSNLDDISSYYSYSGNVFLADTLYVLGGTYTSTSGNDLKINITGGTFTTNNSNGSAIAIYDLGKVSQNMSVNITGNAKFITSSKTRTAYDILNLTDIGVTTPKTGYNNSEYIGKVKTNITAGTYSSIDDKYIATGYEKKLVNGNYTVSKKEASVDLPVVDLTKEVTAPTLGVTNYNAVKGVLLASLEASNIDTTGVNPLIDVNVTTLSEDDLSDSVKSSISSKADASKIVSYFDISVLIKDKDSGKTIGKLTNLTEKVKFTIALPSDLVKASSGMEREFYVVRVHNGSTTIIPATLSKDGKYITFETDKFSTYALAYKDVASTSVVDVKNPQTYDGIVGYVIATILTLGASAGVIITLRKHKFN